MHILGAHSHAMHLLCAVCVLAIVAGFAFGPSVMLGAVGALACAAMMGMMVWMMVGMAIKHRRQT